MGICSGTRQAEARLLLSLNSGSRDGILVALVTENYLSEPGTGVVKKLPQARCWSVDAPAKERGNDWRPPRFTMYGNPQVDRGDIQDRSPAE